MAATNVATLPIVHEDLSDELVLLDADSMVFTSVVRKSGPATNDIYYAPVDKRDTATLGGLKDHERVDRDNVSNRQANRDKIPGVVQHYRETHGVSTLAAKVMNPAGLDDAFADGRVKTLILVKEKMELTNLSQQRHQAGSLTAQFLTQGASAWVDSAEQGNLPVPDAFRPASTLTNNSTTVASVTEGNIRSMLQNLRSAAKKPVEVTGFCSLDFASHFDDFFTEGSTASSVTPIRRFNSSGDQKAYEIGITSYKTRFGKVNIVPTTYLNGTQSYMPAIAACTTTNGSPNITTVSSTAGLQLYTPVHGTGIPAGAYIRTITSATAFTLGVDGAAANATASGNANVTITFGEEDYALFLDMSFFEVKTNMAPTAYEMPVDGAGRDGVVESIGSLFCTYPAVHGKFRKTPLPA